MRGLIALLADIAAVTIFVTIVWWLARMYRIARKGPLG
jgi:hypothetical protein